MARQFREPKSSPVLQLLHRSPKRQQEGKRRFDPHAPARKAGEAAFRTGARLGASPTWPGLTPRGNEGFSFSSVYRKHCSTASKKAPPHQEGPCRLNATHQYAAPPKMRRTAESGSHRATNALCSASRPWLNCATSVFLTHFSARPATWD